MTGFYHHISDLKASFSDMWRINVMVSRIFRPFNPKTNQLLSLDCVFVDERVSIFPFVSFYYLYSKICSLFHLLNSARFDSCEDPCKYNAKI